VLLPGFHFLLFGFEGGLGKDARLPGGFDPLGDRFARGFTESSTSAMIWKFQLF